MHHCIYASRNSCNIAGLGRNWSEREGGVSAAYIYIVQSLLGICSLYRYNMLGRRTTYLANLRSKKRLTSQLNPVVHSHLFMYYCVYNVYIESMLVIVVHTGVMFEMIYKTRE